jgi:hypothetical protein
MVTCTLGLLQKPCWVLTCFCANVCKAPASHGTVHPQRLLSRGWHNSTTTVSSTCTHLLALCNQLCQHELDLLHLLGGIEGTLKSATFEKLQAQTSGCATNTDVGALLFSVIIKFASG